MNCLYFIEFILMIFKFKLKNKNIFRYKVDIEEICLSASREFEFEIKQRVIEDEWNEQMLIFEYYKNRGFMFLDKVFIE